MAAVDGGCVERALRAARARWRLCPLIDKRRGTCFAELSRRLPARCRDAYRSFADCPIVRADAERWCVRHLSLFIPFAEVGVGGGEVA